MDPGLQRTTEIRSIGPSPALQATSETQEKVGQHHTAVPPGSQDGRLRRPMRHRTNRSLSALFEMIRDGLHREIQVGPSVPVGHRKHVDAIELLTLLLRPLAARGESPPEPRAIDISNLHSARSTQTRARATDLPKRDPMQAHSNQAILTLKLFSGSGGVSTGGLD